jgi:hypothetical protein
MAGTALLGTGAAAGLGTAAAATIPELAGAGALGSMVGTGEGLVATLPQITGSASTLAQASPEIAANLASGSAQGITQGLGQTGGEVAGQMQNAGDVMKAAQAGGAPPATNPMPNAGFQPTPGTQPGPLPNVPTVPSPADAQTAANYYSNAQNADIASKVAPQSGGIMDQLKNFTDPLTSGFQKAMDYAKENPKTTAAGLYALSKMTETKPSGGEKYKGSSFRHDKFMPNGPMMNPYLYGAEGGLMGSYADGGPVEQMSNVNAGIMPTTGQNNMYPMSQQKPLAYANPAIQNPISQNVIDVGASNKLDPYSGMPTFKEGGKTNAFQKMLDEEEERRKDAAESLYAHSRSKVEDRGIVSRPLAESSTDPYTAAVNRLKKASQMAGVKMYEMPKQNMPESFSSVEAASGGIMHGLGGYSDGGRLLKGPGDGVSDSIPAVIGNKQPARLADGEFVVPARIVSELGNGSTEAGARKLYAMMERIQKGRRKSVGRGKVAVNSKADKHLPA